MGVVKVINLFPKEEEIPSIFDDERRASYIQHISSVQDWFNQKLKSGEATQLGQLAIVNTKLGLAEFELFNALNVDYNRVSQNKQIKRIAKDMVLGRWQLNGETIIFDRLCQVIDGKHRITAGHIACVNNPELEIPTLIVFGVESSAMVSIDSGLNRADYQRMAIARQNKTHSKSLTSVLKCVSIWFEALKENKQYETMTKLFSPSVEDFDTIYQANPELASAAAKYGENSEHIGSVSSMAFAYYLIMSDNPIEGPLFLEQLKTGKITDEIILTLREKLIRLKKDRIRIKAITVTASIWKTWTRVKAGKKNGKRSSLVIYNPELEQFPHPSIYIEK